MIFKQQQVVVQQMTPQSYVKSNAQSIAGGTHIQHIITSLPVTASASSPASAAGMLTSQIVGQAGGTPTTVGVTAPQVSFTKTLSLTITTTAMATSKLPVLLTGFTECWICCVENNRNIQIILLAYSLL